MLIQGALGAGKTDFLIKKYIELVSSGIKSSEILVLCQNSYLKNKFTEQIKLAVSENHGQINAYTFQGIVYKSILGNWPIFEELIPETLGEAVVYPEMIGVDTTSYLMKKNIKQGYFCDYQSGMNLLHQLLKRHTMISNNALSEQEISQKSRLLKESFSEDAKKVLEALKRDMIKYRCFDYLRQTDAFMKLFSEGRLKDFKNIKYLLVDDFDEMNYQAFYFVQQLSGVTESFITYNKNGGSRRGYLCAYPDGYQHIQGDTINLEAQEKHDIIGSFLGESTTSINIVQSESNSEMLQKLTAKINLLLKNGATPSEIKIVLPEEDDFTTQSLKNFFYQNDIAHQFLSGTQKLFDDAFVSLAVSVCCLIHPEWKIKVEETQIRKLLCDFLKIPFISCEEILSYYKKNKQLPISSGLKDENDSLNYNSLISAIENLKVLQGELSDELIYILKNIILPNSKPQDSFVFFNSLVSSLDDFERLHKKIDGNPPYKEWLLQVKSSIVSDNPSSAMQIEENSIIVATPQKIADYELSGKYQLWLDGKNRAWIKEDTGILYNSWVFQKNFEKGQYSNELHKELTLKKTAHLLHKVANLSEQITVFTSEISSTANENQGELLRYILPKDKKNKQKWTLTPRADQAKVLEYKHGRLAVPAVAGAGKTTIMQALILKLINDGIIASDILVLTYMESAAKNFLERIKKSCPELDEYPHISTIHGLAYKLLSEEGNANRVGLSADFEVCDEAKHSIIINRICLDNLPPGEDFAEWVDYNKSNISRAKMLLLSPEKIETELKKKADGQLLEFLKVYNAYTKALRQAELVDYDDLLILAHKLLSENPDIRAFYQNRFKFIIEDEAQDSSAIQQELINLIAQNDYDKGNLVRCGDLNQAIMTTFTNADIEGFRTFIEESDKVEMQSSQRCTKGVYELANSLVSWAQKDEIFKNAFYPMKMLPVKNSNPKSNSPVNFHSFEHENQELDFVLKEIKKLKDKDPKTSIGILVRNNYQSKNWINFLEKNDIEVVCRADELKDKKIFKLSLALLKFLQSPFENKLLAKLAQEFNQSNLSRISSSSIEFLAKLPTAIIKDEELLHAHKELDTPEMLRFWWDIFYWLDKSGLKLEQLLYKFGQYYFSKQSDLENINLICATIKRFHNTFEKENERSATLKELIKYLDQLGKSRNTKYFKDNESTMPAVEIMTMHKAKGDEFDAVFIPHFIDRYHNINVDKISPREDNILAIKLNNIAGKKQKDKQQIAQEIGCETLRLIYVGITRARKHLYFSKINNESDAYELLKNLYEQEVAIEGVADDN